MKPATLIKVTLFHGCFSGFLICANRIKYMFQVNDVVLVLTLNIFYTFFKCLYYWLWTSKCYLRITLDGLTLTNSIVFIIDFEQDLPESKMILLVNIWMKYLKYFWKINTVQTTNKRSNINFTTNVQMCEIYLDQWRELPSIWDSQRQPFRGVLKKVFWKYTANL